MHKLILEVKIIMIITNSNFIDILKYMKVPLLVGLLLSVSAALLGIILVVKKYSMIGDGLSHVGFGALAFATVLGLSPLKFTIPVVIIAAVLLLKVNENSKIKGDSAIGIISTGALALGVLAISVTTGLNTDLYNYLFGSILAMTKADVTLSIFLSVTVIIVFILFYNKIFAVTFDESFAASSGTNVSMYNMLIAVLTAITIVLGMRMMGSLIISALVIFPAITAMRVCKSFKSVTVTSAVLSVFCFITAIVISYMHDLPTGATIVAINIIVLVIFMFLEKLIPLFKKSHCN